MAIGRAASQARVLLALPLALALGAGALRPAHAEIVILGSSASTSIQVMSGEFLFEFAAPVTQSQNPVVDFTSNQEATPPGPFPATARSRQTARVVPSAGGLAVSADASSFVRVPGVAEPPLSNLIAIAAASFGVSFEVTERATVTASAQALGSINADGASITCSSPGGEFVERRGASVSATIVLEAGGSCGVSAATTVERNGNRDFQALGERTGTLRVNVTVSELGPDDGVVFRYVGPAQGAFAAAGNWENENGGSGVPGFRTFDDADTAIVEGEPAVDLDLSGSLSRGVTPRGVGTPRQTGRFVVRSTQILRPLGGTLILDSLEPGLGERSLEIDGARLLLDQGGVAARHAVVGQGGDGELEVVGPDGFFTTLGRFGVGGDADGNVTIRSGAQVTSAETILGEQDGSGSATVEGAGTLWQTGNLAVGFADSAGLAIDAGAEVQSESGFVDCQLAEGEDVPGCSGLEGDERAEVTLTGNSAWSLTGNLAIGARGKVSVEGGSAVDAVIIEVGTSGTDADCIAGVACLSVVDGSVSAEGVKVGTAGDGKLEIAPAGRVTGAFGVLAGTGDLSEGEIVVRGPSAEAQLVTESTGLALGTGFDSRGVLTLESGARARFGGVSTIGSVEASSGLLDLRGASVLRIEGATSALDLGRDVAADPPEPNAEILLTDATIELADADLNVLRTGRVTGVGSIVGSGVAIVSNAGRIGCGVVVDASYFQDATGVLDCPAASLSSAPLLSPLAASRFARAVRARPVPQPPPPPGPFVVTGDATLGGTLVLQFLNGFAPSLGDSFELLDVGGAVTGAFADVSVRGLAPGADFAEDLVDGKLIVTSLTDAVSLPVVSLKGKKSAIREGKPKSALKLKIKRKGDASQPLAVRYRLRGTADNGFDYDLLPGVIELPARKKSAKLVLHAFPDGVTEGLESFEVELVPGEGYTTSFFSKVAGTIDDEKPKRR